MNPRHQQDLKSAYRDCERIARTSGSSFYCAFLSLPREMFRQMCVVYAFMRVTDDLGDNERLPVSERTARLTNWRSELESQFWSHDSENPVLQAVVDVAQKQNISLDLLMTVIDGVESDLTPRRFPSFEELEKYCYQVAGAVGLCCLKIWGYDRDAAEPLAIACGTAFQLTNILRDLGEDAERGRCYLPEDDLVRFRVSPEQLIDGRTNAEFRELMQFEVARAWMYYRRAEPLLGMVSTPGRRILSGFLASYSSLLRQIEACNYDVFSRRIRLSRWKKSSIAIRSLLGLPHRFNLPESAQSEG